MFSSIEKWLWAQAANTATLLENNTFTPTRDLSPFQQTFGKRKRIIFTLVHKFDEMCITIHHDNSQQAKLANHGNPGIWVGFAEGHPVVTYHAFNTKTRKISLTKDTTFLDKSFGEWNKVKKL